MTSYGLYTFYSLIDNMVYFVLVFIVVLWVTLMSFYYYFFIGFC
jgi:hypothetical protein